MKIRKIALLLAVVLLLGCVLTACDEDDVKAVEQAVEATEEKTAGLPNPMVETDAKGFVEQVGAELNVPQGATDVKYYVIDKTLGQMDFKLNGMDFTARVKSSDKFEDISGMYCKWDVEDDCKIGGRDGKNMRGKTDGKNVDVCLWYDVVPGFMYSLSTQTADSLDGFDGVAVAEQVYKPMQGEVG